jgi:PAS domain S-box-containing protein
MTTTASQVRILIIDDDEGDFLLTKEFIQDIPGQNFQIDWCGSYKQGAKSIHGATHDIYFIDYYLGAKTGIDLLKEAIQAECKEPIVLLTGQGNQKIDLEAMRSGAVDYLIKSELTSEKLDRCIRYSLERAATLKEARANERKFRTIFERSKDTIFISNDQLRFTNVNAAANELLGYSLDELLQMSIYDLIQVKSEKDELFAKIRDRSEVLDFQVEFTTRDQLKKNCILSASYETDSQGNDYIQGIIRDISLLKKVEEIKLQSEKLEAKGMVIRTLAHEIRNPLHNITLSLGYLKNEVSEDNLEFLNVIDRNSKRINDLINELMDSNQYYKMKLEVTPLQAVMTETIEKATDRITLSKIRLDFTYPAEKAYALVDKEKLKIAFLNIIINAIEAMEEETGILTITISSTHDHHRITIGDNGCGMSEEDTGKLFEPYFTSKPKGMGLGLAATYAIVQSHKADIEVHSVLKEGTTFTVTFPSL